MSTTPTPDPLTAPFRYDVASSTWTMGQDLCALHGLSSGEQPTTVKLLAHMHPDDRAEMLERFEHHLSQPGAYSCLYRMTDSQGRLHKLRFVGNAVAEKGVVVRLEGFVLDITGDIARWQTEAVTASAAARAVIEQAKGALMVTFGVDEDDAFRMLVGYSQHHNLKLRDVAAFLTEAIADPHFFNAERPVESLLDIVTLLNSHDVGLAAGARRQPPAVGAGRA